MQDMRIETTMVMRGPLEVLHCPYKCFTPISLITWKAYTSHLLVGKTKKTAAAFGGKLALVFSPLIIGYYFQQLGDPLVI